MFYLHNTGSKFQSFFNDNIIDKHLLVTLFYKNPIWLERNCKYKIHGLHCLFNYSSYCPFSSKQ